MASNVDKLRKTKIRQVWIRKGSGRGRGQGHRGTSKRARAAIGESGSDPEYQASSQEETEEAATRAAKGKSVVGESSHGGGSRTREGRTKRAADVLSARQRLYMSKSCIAERFVNFNDLFWDVPDFGRLLQRAPIEPAGRVPAKAPFCVELIREFYMNGKVLAEDEETGTFLFETVENGVFSRVGVNGAYGRGQRSWTWSRSPRDLKESPCCYRRVQFRSGVSSKLVGRNRRSGDSSC
ncbi:uncharacterized protein LOC109711666 [Ananas comosus]|uniref:Uncharacterized protein LOC109711666 n=1 Tax=Ananas comosus TaxID=4615 RepID=A0A6P5FAB8_ANACO|nr:uncharacterized protein LOC109711666 [Ananas comosus]